MRVKVLVKPGITEEAKIRQTVNSFWRVYLGWICGGGFAVLLAGTLFGAGATDVDAGLLFTLFIVGVAVLCLVMCLCDIPQRRFALFQRRGWIVELKEKQLATRFERICDAMQSLSPDSRAQLYQNVQNAQAAHDQIVDADNARNPLGDGDKVEALHATLRQELQEIDRLIGWQAA